MVELRVLEGPNLYFTRPAIKLTLAVPGWLGVSEERLLTIAGKLGVPAGVKAGPPQSAQPFADRTGGQNGALAPGPDAGGTGRRLVPS